MKGLWITVSTLFSLVTISTGANSSIAAEKYPVKPITFVVMVEAGGGADVQSRPFCEKLGAILGQPVIVVNKPGAGATIANREIHDAKPDGYTIGMGSVAVVINKLQGMLPYDYHNYTILGAFLNAVPTVVAATKTKRPFKTVPEIISYAKLHPKEVSVACTQKGGPWWVAAMEFQSMTGATFNMIPQEGAGAIAVTQVAGGHTDIGIVGLAEAKSQIDAGNVRFLATFGDRRPFTYPDVPTLKELGYDVKVSSLCVAMGPPKMPKEITEKLVKAVEVAAKDPEYRKFLEQRNTISLYLTPEEAIKQYDEQRKVFREILSKAGILKEK